MGVLRRSRTVAMAGAASVALSGCISPVAGPGGNYTTPIGNSTVTVNPTPYSAALVCLSEYAQHYGVRAPRIAVGRIADYTGKAEDNGGREVTQGASLMAISALAKAGAPLVERYDTSVSELELKYANNKLISDQPDAGGPAGPGPTGPAPFRKILAGEVPGSDFYLVGGITELNYNIRSSGLDAQGGKQQAQNGTGIATGQLYVMNVALDLRLVETKTLEVVDVISYQQEIIGRQVGLGLFKFFGSNVIDVSAGEGGLQPIQLAVRSMVERGVLEMMSNLYGAPGPQTCLDPNNDPIGAPTTTGLTGGYYPAYNNLDQNNARTREDPHSWTGVPSQPVALRGRY